MRILYLPTIFYGADGLNNYVLNHRIRNSIKSIAEKLYIYIYIYRERERENTFKFIFYPVGSDEVNVDPDPKPRS